MHNKNKYLCAPHPDDETLGVGGTIAKFAKNGADIFVLIISGTFHLYKPHDYKKTVSEANLAFKIRVLDSKFLNPCYSD